MQYIAIHLNVLRRLRWQPTPTLRPLSRGRRSASKPAYVTTEYASLDRAGAPITWPVTPYVGESCQTSEVFDSQENITLIGRCEQSEQDMEFRAERALHELVIPARRRGQRLPRFGELGV